MMLVVGGLICYCYLVVNLVWFAFVCALLSGFICL